MFTISDKKRRFYYILYGIGFFFTGAQYAVPGALFARISDQLNITTQQMSIIYSFGEVSIGISALIIGYFVDYACKNHSHLLLSILGFLSAFGYYAMLYIESYWLMILDWIVVSCALGGIECAAVVYLYRISSKQSAATVITANFMLMGVGSIVTAQIITISINHLPEHNYGFALNFMAVIAIIFSIMALILKTPPPILQDMQDILEQSNTINKTPESNTTKTIPLLNEFGSDGSDGRAESITGIDAQSSYSIDHDLTNENKIKDNTKKSTKSNESVPGVIFFRIMIVLIIGLYAGQKDTYLSLGVTYATKHYGISEAVSLYLITSFWTGKMISQIVITWLVSKFEPDIIICSCQILMALNVFMFILIELSDDDWKIQVLDGNNHTLISILLISVYGIAAAVSIPVYVVSFSFIKKIENMTAFLSAIILVSYTFGCGLFVFIAGSLFQHIGAWTYPFTISTIIAGSFCLWCYTYIKYKKYQQSQMTFNDKL